MQLRYFLVCFLFSSLFVSSLFGMKKRPPRSYYYPSGNYSYSYNPHPIKKPSLLKKYLISTVSAVIVGGVTGSLCAVTDKSGFWPFSWFIFPSLRCVILDALAQDFIGSDVPYNKRFSEEIARITDWAAWLYTMGFFSLSFQ